MKEGKSILMVADLFRDSLQPYAELFENIVIPMVKQASWGMIDKALAKKLRLEIAEYENRKKQPLHYILLYCGLMLCCMHTTQSILDTVKRVDRRAKQINLVNKARLLICLAYQQEQFTSLPFMF